MKTLRTCVVTAIMLLTFASTTIAAADPVRNTRAQTSAEAEEARTIIARIEVINGLDKTKLTASEKKDLRKEVRNSKKRLEQVGGGVYVSVGALILIIILLIILL